MHGRQKVLIASKLYFPDSHLHCHYALLQAKTVNFKETKTIRKLRVVNYLNKLFDIPQGYFLGPVLLNKSSI